MSGFSSARLGSPPAGRFERHWIKLGILVLAVVASYATAVPAGFVWVDNVEIVEGGYRILDGQDFWLVWLQTLDSYLDRQNGPITNQGGYWRPLVALSWSADWLLWRDRPEFYHLENIIWHVGVVWGLYALGLRLLADLLQQRKIAFWATLLFAVHPLGVHSVTWISGRKDTLCTLCAVFSLLALSRILDWVQSRNSSASRLWIWGGLATLFYLLALAAKELAVVVPLVALLLFWGTSEVGMARCARARRAYLLAVGGLTVCLLAYLTFRVMVLGAIGLGGSYPVANLSGNVAMVSDLWWHYLACVLLPLQPSISDRWPIATSLSIGSVWALLLLVVIFWVVSRRWRSLAVGLWWYLLWTLPAIGLLPLRHFRAERYLYPASWGLLLSVVVVLFAANQWWATFSRWARVDWLLTGLALFSVVLTARANFDWWDDRTLFTRAVQRDGQYIEGRLALASLALEAGDFQQVIDHSRRALTEAAQGTHTGYFSSLAAHTNLGLALYYQGALKEAQMEFSWVARHWPTQVIAHYHLGLLAFSQGDLSAAEQHYRRALMLKPDDFFSQSNLAATWLRQQKFARCAEILRPLVEQRPHDMVNLDNYASALLSQKKFSGARPLFARLVKQQPDAVAPRAKLAWCQWETGQRPSAQRHLERAARQQPDHPTVLFLQHLFSQKGEIRP